MASLTIAPADLKFLMAHIHWSPKIMPHSWPVSTSSVYRA